MNYLFLVLIALFIGSAKEIFKKKILSDIKPIQFLVVFYGVMFLFAQVTIAKISTPSIMGWILLLLSSAFYVLANLLGLKSLKELRISVIKPMSGLESVFVIFMSFFILKELLTGLQILGMTIIVAPLAYIILKQYKKNSLSKKQITFIFLSLFFAAITTIIDRIALRTIDPISYFYFLKLTLIIMFIAVMLTEPQKAIDISFVKNKIIPISILAIFTMIGTYAYFFALKDPSANTGIIKTVLSTSIIFSTYFGGKYFRDTNLKEQLIITFAVIIGINILLFS